MSLPIIRIHNTETDEIIDREMTEDEFAEFMKETEEREAEQAAKVTKREAEQAAKVSADAKLTAFYESIGLTPDEIAAKL